MTVPTPYEDLLRDVLKNGEDRSDRTGTGTRGVFGRQIRFDLQKGFPLIGTKKVFTKGIIAELLWLLSGDTNAKTLESQGVKIWSEWAAENGDLGPVYGASWRAIYAPSNKMIQVEKRTDRDADFQYPYTQSFLPRIDCDLNSDEMWAVEDLGAKSGNRRYKVQLKTGFITEISRPNWRSLKDISIVDGYAKNVAGVGFLGEPIPANERLYELWYNMIARCYNTSHPSYKYYGERGVTVSPIWHSFEYFSRTISKVPGYHKLVQGERLDLDKDYFGSKVYSPDTCVFLPISHNVSCISEDGHALQIEDKLYATYTDWADGNGKTAHYAKSRWDAGLSYKGIPASSVTWVAPDENHLWRKRVFFDQFGDLMKELKKNPFSRRHIIDAWNAPALPDQALPPCHAMIQFYVTPDADGNPKKLSCQLYQRSADMFLGVPFNIASYALLTHMVAQQVGLEVGEFVHSFGDCHIYSNHFEQVEEQLSRDARPYPQLVIKRKPESIFDYKLEDFEIVGYDPHPTIKAAVSV